MLLKIHSFLTSFVWLTRLRIRTEINFVLNLINLVAYKRGFLEVKTTSFFTIVSGHLLFYLRALLERLVLILGTKSNFN